MSIGSIHSAANQTPLSDRARQTFGTNLEALRRRAPRIAEIVASTDRPSGAFALGRDGEMNFRLPAAHRGSRWFAQCSMPSIAAAEGLGGFVHEGGSVALPGISTGWEARQLLAKLPPGDAIFVIEPDAAAVRIALHLVDLSAALQSGRIVLLLGPEWDQRLMDVVTAHPGHALPQRIVTIPQRSPVEIMAVQQRLESAVATAADRQNTAVQASVEAIRERSMSDAAIERVAVIAGDESPAGLDFARRVIRGLEQLCKVEGVCLPNRPEHRHVAAPLRLIETTEPDLTILAGPGWDALEQVLPSGLALRLVPEGIVRDASREDNGQVIPVQAFAPASDPAATYCDGEQAQDRVGRVAFLADCPDDSAASIGVELPSQRAVWNAMRERAAKLARATTRISAEDLLSHAERSCGAEMRETDVRADFVRLADQRILSAARLRREWDALRSTGASATIVGAGWIPETANSPAPQEGHVAAATLSTDEFIDRFRRAASVIFASPMPLLPERVLDAAACGCRVAVSDHALSTATREVLQARSQRIAFYNSTDALVRWVKGATRESHPERAASHVENAPDCSATAQLRKILQQLRS